MLSPASSIPIPYVEVTADLRITAASKPFGRIFPPIERLTELVDEESMAKARQWLHPHSTLSKLELNLRSRESKLMLCELHQQWTEERGCIVLMPLNDAIEPLQYQLSRLREHLQERNTPFSLPAQLSSSSSRSSETQTVLASTAVIRDMLHLVRTDLIEAGKSYCLEAIDHELNEIEAQMKE